MKFSAKLKVSASKSATSPSCKPLVASLTDNPPINGQIKKNKKMKNLILTMTAIGLLLTSCNQTTQTKNEEITETAPFNANVDITTEKVSASEIKATVKTNFPENTSLTITASRDYKRKNNNEQYAADLYYSFSSIVKDGQVSFTFNPLDKGWIDEYEALRKQNGSFDKSMTEIDKKSIKDTIEISVLFTPKGKQPENVVKIIGANGENLNGAEVQTNNNVGFKFYDKKIKFYSKFKN